MAELVFMENRPREAVAESGGTPRVAFVTLGCKVNQSDTQKAMADFRAAGFRLVSPASPAEVYVVNTCSVTHVADRKSRQWLRRGARGNPDALVVATGCYAESGRETLSEMDEVGLVVGYKEKDDLLGLVLERRPELARARENASAAVTMAEGSRTPSWLEGEDDTGGEAEFRQRTRAMVKIEDGCNDFCTFCIIPFTRGMPRSTPTNAVVEMVNRRLAEGFKEIVLTGVHMGKYGQDHAQRKRSAADPSEADDLPGVVRAVLERTEVPRLRLTSFEPTDAVMMIPLFTDPAFRERLVPHMHLPLQSGCDATLARMKRDYTTAEYAEVVRQVRAAVPGISITTDLITGFPGEDEEEWAQTVAFVQRMQFSKLHVFPYSQRQGTPAATMPGQVHPDVRHARTLEMMEISAGAEAAFAAQHLGTTHAVLWETEQDGVWSGLTETYVRVHTRAPGRDLLNEITPAVIIEYDAAGLWGLVR